LDEFSKSSHVDENKDENYNLQEENFILSYTPYEYLLRSKFDNEIKEPTPNAQEYFSLVTYDKNPKEHWQQEKLMEDMNLEKKDEQDFLYKKEESFQGIMDESRTLEAVGDKEKYECILMLEAPQLIKDISILEQPRFEFIELWFQSIVGQTMQSNFYHTWFNIYPVHIESIPKSLVQVPKCFKVMEFIPNINSMLEWLHWKVTYT
jgi:hypothetical protein